MFRWLVHNALYNYKIAFRKFVLTESLFDNLEFVSNTIKRFSHKLVSWIYKNSCFRIKMFGSILRSKLVFANVLLLWFLSKIPKNCVIKVTCKSFSWVCLLRKQQKNCRCIFTQTSNPSKFSEVTAGTNRICGRCIVWTLLQIIGATTLRILSQIIHIINSRSASHRVSLYGY